MIALLLAVGTVIVSPDNKRGAEVLTGAPPAGSPGVVVRLVDGHFICDSGCGGAASFLDSAAFTAGSTAVNIVAGVFNDSLSVLTAGQAGAPRLTSKRALHFNMRDAAGNEVSFPAALDADGGFKIHVQNPVTSVNVSNFPANQTVSWSGQSVGVSNFPANQTVSWSGQSVSVSNFPGTQPVSLASAPLPSNAAQADKQDTGNTALNILAAAVGAENTAGPATAFQIGVQDTAGTFHPLAGSVAGEVATLTESEVKQLLTQMVSQQRIMILLLMALKETTTSTTSSAITGLDEALKEEQR